MLDLTELLAPTTEAPPCGKNLEYDPLFAQIARAATRIPPKESGAHKTGGQEPKWTEVLDVGKTFFARSKDLRVAVYVTRALVQKQGVEGLATGLALIRELLDKYWDAVHPKIEEVDADENGSADDANPEIDGTMRLNALAALHDAEGLVSEIRAAYLINTRAHGQVRVRDIEVALGRLPANENSEVPSLDTLRGQISAAVAAGSKAAEIVNACVDALAAIRTSLTSRLGVEGALEFKQLNDVLAPLKTVCDEAVPDNTESDEPGIETPQPGDQGIAVSAPPERAIAGEIRSREDAVRVLNKVCLYLEKHEPSNPAPLFIRRAERLMTKSFVQIVEDLLPDSLSSLERLAGKLESDSAASR